jgi:hypothetical protein
MRDDQADGYTETFTISAAPHLKGGVPDGTEASSGLQTLSRAYVNAAGQTTTVDSYFNLSGLAYTTAVMGDGPRPAARFGRYFPLLCPAQMPLRHGRLGVVPIPERRGAPCRSSLSPMPA